MKPFMNTNMHPDMYENSEKITAPNQDYYMRNAFDMWKRDQQQARTQLFQAVHHLNQQFTILSTQHKKEIDDIRSQLATLDMEAGVQEQFREETERWLAMLDENQGKLEQLLEHDRAFKQTIQQEMSDLNASQQTVLEELTGARTQLLAQMDRVLELHEQVTESLAAHEAEQTHLVNRMADQEALLEKVTRQISHVRSILFERSTYLADKIDDSWRQTSDYLYQWVKGKDQPLTLLNTKKSEQTERTRETQ
ncbi:hypothetical protein [Lentibacillus saliphilus]|uniref:hypothetical protein n=1 Tax=Lentibacillus saliphilus TaxID=2737028 RepID=UPI001C2F8E0D|nr:hypothetical protein [Lentibacillus saliphilus]